MADFTTPDKPYTEVKSEHIKEKIKGSNFDNSEQRKKVNKLIFLERQITGEISLGYPGGFLYDKIKKKYSEDYEKIYNELRPEKYKSLQKEKEKKRKRIEEKKKKRKLRKEKRVKQAKKEWMRVKQ